MVRRLCCLAFVLCVSKGLSISITGNFATDGWISHGTSLDLGKWAAGTTSGNHFNAYTKSFVLSNSDFAASYLVGNTSGLLADGASWQVGDRIVGIGAESTGLGFLSGIYYKVDFAGTGNWKPASTVGGNDGISGSAASSTYGALWGYQHPHTLYKALPHRYTDLSGNMNLWGTTPNMIDFTSAIKAYSLLGTPPGEGQSQNAITSQFLINYSQLERLGVPIGDFGPSKIVIGGYGQDWGQDMVIGGSGGVNLNPVPEPGTVLFGIGGALAFLRKRRRLRGAAT